MKIGDKVGPAASVFQSLGRMKRKSSVKAYDYTGEVIAFSENEGHVWIALANGRQRERSISQLIVRSARVA